MFDGFLHAFFAVEKDLVAGHGRSPNDLHSSFTIHHFP
jgi:hypothetical protein